VEVGHRAYREVFPVEERLLRVDPELPTVYGGQVNLVEGGAGDLQELVEMRAWVGQAALNPIVSLAGFLPVDPEFPLVTCSVLVIQKTRCVCGRLGVPLIHVGCPNVGSLKKCSAPDILAHLL
jgi:hypothetical protein